MLLQPQHSIGDNEVHVWHLLAENVDEQAAQQALDALLSSAEQKRMASYGHERDRQMFLLARALTRSVLASYLDCPCEALEFTSNAFGKPILHADPPPVQFNLSHSRGAVALAISSRHVGVDIEERERRVDFLGLADRYFSEPEARYLATLPEAERGEAFLALWTLKEAYIKGIGQGLTFPLDAFCFDLESSRLRAFRPLKDFVACDWHFHQFHLGDRHCGALAVQGSGVTVEMRDWAKTFLHV